jgi:hypothetical protein
MMSVTVDPQQSNCRSKNRRIDHLWAAQLRDFDRQHLSVTYQSTNKHVAHQAEVAKVEAAMGAKARSQRQPVDGAASVEAAIKLGFSVAVSESVGSPAREFFCGGCSGQSSEKNRCGGAGLSRSGGGSESTFGATFEGAAIIEATIKLGFTRAVSESVGSLFPWGKREIVFVVRASVGAANKNRCGGAG